MRKVLPEKYYLDHFHEFLNFFEGCSGGLLDNDSWAFIHAFRALSEPKQCIVARAANRKYGVINATHFNYQEIPSPRQQLDSLTDDGWFGSVKEAPKRDLAGMLLKEDILCCLAEYPQATVNKTAKKASLLNTLFTCIQHSGWPTKLPVDDYLYCRFDGVMRFLLFVYFGNTKGRLNQFSLRDLGVMRTREQGAGEQSHFDSADDAAAGFYYGLGIDDLSYLNESELVAKGQETQPKVTSTNAQRLAEKYCFKLGVALLAIDSQLALTFLKSAPGDNCKEKWLREAYKAGEKDEVKKVLEAIIDTPASDTLLAFAEDFYLRKFHKKRTSTVTDMLRSATRKLDLDESQNQSVEQGVIGWYKRHGAAAWRTENRLWRSLFGLVFWPLLYEKDSLVTEFDQRPKSLQDNCFYATFASDIEGLFNTYGDNKAMDQYVVSNATRYYGQGNSLFLWSPEIMEPIKALFTYASYSQITTILRAMAEDFAQLKDGFPDILVLEKGLLRFEEIKAPGDQLRRNQLVTIQKLRQAGFDVQITQVNWYRDPNQPYVVVDIETTGGNNQYHRITEIGMVKLVNGEVVDKWQSLINPQRAIPGAITRLTGITNAMVADAPVFEQVADAIDRFTQDCVFVAHNVNFDYGFVRQEFSRLEQSYRRPKLCTVRESRKHFPGLSSYSLAALTHHFDIAMEQHHRALSDAQAAAELLKITQGRV
ncbi:exonuclease domain-containing protein [Alteromonas sp. C1M14]|uniref:exonuclease domain-containing protein n=1 Tax=Alteromonas sp. C1M14 TaxID=2841567 RepID=UPI001C098C76|nr:exonuclease domain-containing protein [Alteromonas sp. C1M14]MBU2978287.1 VRR-NUC domain-containing protein [Alteromonas sp. C1M14]